MQVKTRRVLLIGALLIGSLCVLSSGAKAVPYSFAGIEGSTANMATGTARFSVDVTAVNSTGVSFLFANSGTNLSSITDIYFDEYSPNAPLGAMTLAYPTTGVSFAEFASPGNVPGGNAPSISFSATRSADSNSPVSSNGINPSEQLNMSFDLINGQTFANVITALNASTLRIALHAQSFSDGGSAAFVNNGGGNPGQNPIPEPATMLLFGTGLVGFAAWNMNRRD